ncbi:MAG: hypothetical protein ACOYIK_10580 [Coriobacteriales bacterium]|jgi:hypothetical protein
MSANSVSQVSTDPGRFFGFSEDDWNSFNEEQRRAASEGKRVYDYSSPDIQRKVNILSWAFIGVGAMFFATGIILFAINIGVKITKFEVAMFVGVMSLGVVLLVAGVLIRTLKKHPQWTPLIRWGMLGFCVAAALMCVFLTDRSGETVFTDVLQTFIIWYALFVFLRQAEVKRVN